MSSPESPAAKAARRAKAADSAAKSRAGRKIAEASLGRDRAGPRQGAPWCREKGGADARAAAGSLLPRPPNSPGNSSRDWPKAGSIF